MAWREEVADVLLAILQNVPAALPVSLLVPAGAEAVASAALRPAGRALTMVTAAVTSPWVRDFGPLLVQRDGGSRGGAVAFVDARYGPHRDGDDGVPAVLAAAFGAPHEPLALSLEGGNLVTDGAGLCFATARLYAENPGMAEAQVGAALRERLGCDELIIVPRLRREPTGHVDLQVGFVAGRLLVATAVTGTFAADDGALLDDLAETAVAARRARGHADTAVRLPLLRLPDGVALSYVQVVAVGDRLLVPSYRGLAVRGGPRVDEAFEAGVQAAYRKAFPQHELRIVPLAARARLGGGLRCLTLALP